MATRLYMAGINMSIRTPILLTSILLLALMASNVVAHEQKLYTIVIHEQGETQPVNLIDGKFLEGDIVWFKNVDNRANYTAQAWVDLDNDGVLNASNDFVSAWMYGDDQCPKDDEGNLTNPDCRESQQFAFNFTNAVGNYSFVIYHAVDNDTANASITHNGSISVNVDNHTDPGQPTIGDCFGIGCDEVEDELDDLGENSESMPPAQMALVIIFIISIISSVGLALSIINEKKEEEKDYSHSEE